MKEHKSDTHCLGRELWRSNLNRRAKTSNSSTLCCCHRLSKSIALEEDLLLSDRSSPRRRRTARTSFKHWSNTSNTAFAPTTPIPRPPQNSSFSSSSSLSSSALASYDWIWGLQRDLERSKRARSWGESMEGLRPRASLAEMTRNFFRRRRSFSESWDLV